MRKAMVTRTINYYELTVMVVDTQTRTVSEMVVKYTGDSIKTDKILAEISEQLPINIQPVSILKSEKIEKLYGMYEDDFIKYAKPMNNRFEKI